MCLPTIAMASKSFFECVEEDLLLAEVDSEPIPIIAFRAESNKAVEGRNVLIAALFDRFGICQISVCLLAESTAAYAGAILSPHTTCDFQAKTHAQHSTNAHILRAYYI